MARIAVLSGGSTPERTVALAGAAKVSAALRGRGHDVTVFDTVEPGPLDAELERQRLGRAVGARPPSLAELRELRAREDLPALVAAGLGGHDAVFLVLHGRQGEGGEVQEMLEAAGIAFTGSDARGSRLAMDKDRSKRRFRDAGIPTPDWLTWPARQSDIEELGLPLIVKPSRVGSTVGLTLVSDLRDLDSAVGKALAFDDEVILERFLPGREYTAGVLDGQVLGVGEIVSPGVIFDFHSKYAPGRARELFPAEIDEVLRRRLRELVLAAHQALALRDVSRVDFRLDAAGSPCCLEVNTLPGMTPTSLLPQSAAVFGISYADLCDRMVCLALRRSARSESEVRRNRPWSESSRRPG